MPAAGVFNDQSVKEILPGIQIYKPSQSRFIFVRVYKKDLQGYIKRSTGKLNEAEAREWVINNLETLYAIKPARAGDADRSRVVRRSESFICLPRQKQRSQSLYILPHLQSPNTLPESSSKS